MNLKDPSSIREAASKNYFNSFLNDPSMKKTLILLPSIIVSLILLDSVKSLQIKPLWSTLRQPIT